MARARGYDQEGARQATGSGYDLNIEARKRLWSPAARVRVLHHLRSCQVTQLQFQRTQVPLILSVRLHASDLHRAAPLQIKLWVYGLGEK